MKSILAILCLSILLVSCKTNPSQSITSQSIEAHGGQQYEKNKIAFDFRNIHYTYQKIEGQFTYTRAFEDSLGYISDVLTNDNFTRSIDGQTIELDEEWTDKYSNSVNSVIYFALLPYGLNDGAVNKSFKRKETISGKSYDLVEVTFEEEGGGKDHSDVFYYLINKDTKYVDYLAYTYETDGGGIRFREAFNQRKIGGIVFNDYVNYSPDKEIEKTTSLDQILDLYKEDKLNKLSLIELKNLQVSKY